MHVPGFTADTPLSATLTRSRADYAVEAGGQAITPQFTIPWWVPPVAIGAIAGELFAHAYVRVVAGPEPPPVPAAFKGCASQPPASSCPGTIGGVGMPCVYEGGFCTRTNWLGYDVSGTCTTVKTGFWDSSSLGSCKCDCV